MRSSHHVAEWRQAGSEHPAYVLTRRTFLARIGVLGAMAGTAGAAALLPAGDTAAAQDLLSIPVSVLRPVLAELARDTINGLSAFVLPGNDPYSTAQGTPRTEPGAIAAKATDFYLDALDNFVPFPDQYLRPLAAAFVTAVDDSGIELPVNLGALLPVQLIALDEALARVLANDETLPISFLVAGLLNLSATRVNPAALHGLFVSPFARLSYDEKARVFQLIEQVDPALLAMLDRNLPQPLHNSLSGLLRFLGGALLEFGPFGAMTEYAVYDRRTRRLTARPIGWTLSGYQPDGPVEGWDDFRGYYQGRTEVRG
jgi:hypothetical protein